LRAQHAPPGGFVGRVIGRALDGLTRGYAAALGAVLRHRIAVGLVTIATIATTVYLYRAIPFGLFPQQDTGMLSGQSRARQDISFDAMKVRQQEISKLVRSDPAVDHVIANVGGNGSTTTNTGALFIALKPKAERDLSAQQVIDRLRPKLGKLKGVTMAPQAVQDLTIGGRIGTGAQYQYALTDANLDELNAWGPKVTAALRKLPEIKDVVSDQQTQGLELDLDIDRDTAAQLGITVAAIDNALYDAFGQRQVAVFYTQVNEYRVVLEVAPETGTGVDALNRIYVPSVANGQIPLSTLVKIKEAPVALSIGHQGQFPATTISFNLTTGVALGDAVKAIERATAAIQVPASIHGSFSGFAQAFQNSLKSEPYLILIALLAVYIALGVLYESYVHPITIVSTLPSAGLGALLALELTSTDLSIIALIGIILLIGIVMKNAILMVDFAIAAERDGTPPEVAIYQAAVMRFRPILMTTLAALLGALPLALGTGTGSELRRPLGIAIVGGLIVSQLLNLFTTPVTYLALHRFTRKRPRLHEFV
jgi:multidrug efflux pump subunit AcrB